MGIFQVAHIRHLHLLSQTFNLRSDGSVPRPCIFTTTFASTIDNCMFSVAAIARSSRTGSRPRLVTNTFASCVKTLQLILKLKLEVVLRREAEAELGYSVG